jgi:coenzyme F420-reducing hydrogenase beta subunit
MEADDEGFCYPQVDSEKCIECGKCEKVCPIINRGPVSTQQTEAFAAWNVNDDVRQNSSSGGIFTLLAETILEDGGTVFGAAFAPSYRSVQHIRIEDSEDLQRLRGSKYLQSVIGDSYKQAKVDLDSGKPVLFTGTPCQIAGLYAYLGKNYPQLYTQDIICHGVPSPKAWSKYLDYREMLAVSKVKEASFRHKQYGWKKYDVKFKFENQKEYVQDHGKDLYMRGFLSELCLRPSCHNCAFKGINRQADITLADFWGIDQLMPSLDDDKGVSLVLVHSEKGNELLEKAKKGIRSVSVSLDDAVKFNSAAVKSVKPHPKREYFFSYLDKTDFPKLIDVCLYKTPCARFKSFAGRAWRKLKRLLGVGRTI